MMDAARRAASMRLFARVAGLVVIVEALLVLAGWALDVEVLKSVFPGFATMKPNTAIAFLLAGLLVRSEASRPAAAAPGLLGTLAALLVALVGLLTLLEYVLGVDLGIDDIVFRDSVRAYRTADPGRMAFLSAAGVALLGVGLWAAGRRGIWTHLTQALALLVAFVSLIALIGYVYGVQSLYRVGGDSPMAIHNAAALFLLAHALLLAHPERGVAATVASDGPGGRAARRLLPVAALVPFALGWLRVRGEQRGLYDTSFGASVMVLALIAIFSAVILWNARYLDLLEGGRRAAEEATLEKSRTLELVLDHMSDGVVVADPQGHFLLFNRAAEEVLGNRVGNMAPEEWSAHFGLFATDAKSPYPSADLPLARAIRGEEVNGVELVVRHPGRPKNTWLSVSARPIQDPTGVLQGAIAIFSDVTERRRAQELEEARRRAEQASRLKSEFLANMSHELRTPLNAVIGFAELLHDGKVGSPAEEQKELLADILSSSRHLLQLINDILDLSKVEAGKMEFRPEPVDVERAVEEVRDILRHIASAKRIRVTTDVATGLGEVVVDPGKLKQVLYNYLSNALKFTADQGRVVIRVGPEGTDRFRLEVEDTGIGIEPEDLARLFVDFQQLDASRAKRYAGTGLGLALTKRLVEAQAGRVGARSEPRRGSTFYAILPRVADRRGVGSMAGASAEEEGAAVEASPPAPGP